MGICYKWEFIDFYKNLLYFIESPCTKEVPQWTDTSDQWLTKESPTTEITQTDCLNSEAPANKTTEKIEVFI